MRANVNVPCPACEAEKGEPCRRPDGTSYGGAFVHAARKEAARAARSRRAAKDAPVPTTDQPTVEVPCTRCRGTGRERLTASELADAVSKGCMEVAWVEPSRLPPEPE